MAVRTRSSSSAAQASLVSGLAGLAVAPAAIGVARYLHGVTLVQAVSAIPFAALLGLLAILFSRRERRHLYRTRTARIGRLLGLVAVCVGITGGLTLGFYGLLTLFSQ